MKADGEVINLDDDKVKWPSKKKYPCKRNKGNHEWGTPVIVHSPCVVYEYDYGDKFLLHSDEYYADAKFIQARIRLVVETLCKHCGKKEVTFFSEKIK